MSASFEMKIKNQRVLKMFDNAPARVEEALLQNNLEMAPIILETIRRFASSPPGPRKVTGRYIDSIVIEEITATKICFKSDAPQAKRLEYGFVGVDSLGRHYHQPPFPHWRPALAYWRGPWARSLGRTAAKAVFGRPR